MKVSLFYKRGTPSEGGLGGRGGRGRRLFLLTSGLKECLDPYHHQREKKRRRRFMMVLGCKEGKRERGRGPRSH